MKRLRAGFTFLLCLCLVAVEPGAGAWAAVAERVALPQGLRALSGPVAPTLAAPAPFLHTALAPSALAPSLVPAPRAGTAVLGARLSPVVVSPAALRTPSAELSASEAGRPFDQSGSAASAPDDPVAAPVTPLGPRRNLGLVAADEITLAAFTAEFHDETARQYGKYGFTVRDYYAWANYIRFFMPSLGVREAARRGAAYVYGDRLEDENELKDFTKALNRKIDAVIPASAALAKHGIDKAEAQRLLKIAEPAPETLADDEESPFHVPLAQLVPRLENVDLVPTPTTLRRIDSAYQAFSMRDFALLLGPPATQKSVIPKYLAAKLKIPHLAVTMHPGIGTFELVGGYRPKVVKITSLDEARRIIARKLAVSHQSDEFSEVMESAVRVYGGLGLEAALRAIDADLAAGDTDPQARRRLLTLAHGIEFGASSLVWQDGYLTYALKRDIWITFEEINAAPTESQEFLNEFMRTRRLVISQKLGEGEILSPRPGGRFMLWATMNPETDPNREVLAQTLKNRWRVKSFGHLPAFEQAEIIEKKFGLPTNWALALVQNFHTELHRQAANRLIGDQWRDGYEINLRHLLKVCRRWKLFMNQEEELKGARPDRDRQLFLLAREAFSIYGGMMRTEGERQGVFTMLDQALRLGAHGWTSASSLTVQPTAIEDVGDAIRIGDVTLPKGPGGPFVPKPSSDYLLDAGGLERLYEYAKALAAGEPLLVMGESAAGKTSDLEYLFFRLNLNMRYKNLDSDTAIEEVIGGYAPGSRRGQFVYAEGLLPRAMEERSGAFLDEFNLNPLVEWLNTVVDDDRLYLPHRIVTGHPYIVAAANPPEARYPGRVLLSPATRSRYTERWAPHDASVPRLKRLMGHWLQGGTVYAAFLAACAGVTAWIASPVPGLHALEGGGWLSRLRGWFGSKKKAPADSALELAVPATLEDLLKAHKIHESEWPAYRDKVGRIQTLMRMVGSSIGRDSSLKWEPGDLWAFFPDLNTATYPFEHLITHTEEELVGVIDHESLHRESTVLDERLPLVRKYVEDPIKHFLWNGLEDPRINSRGVSRLPGAQRYLHALYDRYLPENLEARPADAGNVADGSAPQGDAGAAFNPQTLRYPHVEFVMAANYYWRHGKKPPKFFNRSAEEAFDKALLDMRKVFGTYSGETQPSREESLAYTVEALRRIDEKILPLYEPLVKESEKKISKERKGKGKGKGQKSGPPQKGGSPQGGGAQKPSQPPKPQDGDKKPNPEKPERGGQGEPKDEDGEPDPQARRILEDQAREAAKKLGGKITENPTRPKGSGGKKGKPKSGEEDKPGDNAPKPLSIEDIARTRREQLLDRGGSPYQRAYEAVAHLSSTMVTHLENVFLKNSRARDVGYYKQGKRPDVKRYMKRQGEGGVRDDFMLRRAQKTKRRYKVALLVDESGSMDQFRREAINAVVLFVDSLSRLQIDVEVVGFSDKARIHKTFEEPLTQPTKERLIEDLQTAIGDGNTHDADALKLVLDRMGAQEADGRFVFVISDGRGNGPSRVADVLPQADLSGISVVGVGIGEGMSYVSSVYPRHVAVPEIAQLPGTLRGVLVEAIARREAGMTTTIPGVAQGEPGLHALPGQSWRPSMGLLAAVGLAVALGSIMAAAFLFPKLGIILGIAAVAAPGVFLKRWISDRRLLAIMGFFSVAVGQLAASFDGGAIVMLAGLYPMIGFGALYYRTDLARALAPLAADLSAQVKASSPEPGGVWTRGLLGWKPARLKTLRAMAGQGRALPYVPVLRLLAGEAEDLDTRQAAVDALRPLAVHDADALDALRALSRGPAIGEYVLREIAETEALAAKAAEEVKQLDAVTRLAREARENVGAFGPLIERAQVRLSAMDGSSLAGEMRVAALSQAVDALREALAASDGAQAAVAAQRLSAQLDGAAAGSAGLGVLPGLGILPLKVYAATFTRHHALVWAGVTAFGVALFALPIWIGVALVLAASVFWGKLAFKFRDGSILPLLLMMGSITPVFSLASVLTFSASFRDVAFPVMYTLVEIAEAAIYLAITTSRRQPMHWDLKTRLARAHPTSSSRRVAQWAEDLTYWRVQALLTLRRIKADADLGDKTDLDKLLPMLILLAQRAWDDDTRVAAVEAIGAIGTSAAETTLDRLYEATHFGRARNAILAESQRLKARAAALLERQRELADLAAKVAAPKTAHDLLLERADAALALSEDAGLSAGLRRAALRATTAELRGALGDGQAAAVAARRLEEQLSQEPAAGEAGLHALPSLGAIGRALRPPPWLGAALIVLGLVGAVFGVVALTVPWSIDNRQFLFIASIVSFVFGWNHESLRVRRWTLGAGSVLFIACVAASSFMMKIWPMGFFAVGGMALRVFWPAFHQRLTWSRGIPDLEAGYRLRSAASSLRAQHPRAAAWLRALTGDRDRRARAFAEMMREPGAARPALRALQNELLWHDNSLFNESIVDLMVRWGDEESESILAMLASKTGHSAAGYAAQAMERLKRDRAETLRLQEIVQLARPKAAPLAEDVLAEARRALEGAGENQSLSAKLWSAALRQAVQDVEAAPDATARAIALQRLRAQLDGGNSGASGLAVLPSSEGIVLVPGRSLGRFETRTNYGLALMALTVVYFFVAAAAHFGNPLAFFAAIALTWTGVIWSDRVKRANSHSSLAPQYVKTLTRWFSEADGRRWLASSAIPAGRRRMPWTGAFAELVTSCSARRRRALKDLAPSGPDEDLLRVLYGLALAETTPENADAAVEAIGRVGGAPAIEVLRDLESRALPVSKARFAAAAERAALAERELEQSVVGLALPPAPASAVDELLARSDQAIAAIPEEGSLAEQLRRAALVEAAQALRAVPSDGDGRVPERRLRALLDSSNSGEAGLTALADSGFQVPLGLRLRLGAYSWGATLTAVAAIALVLCGPGSWLVGGALAGWVLRPVRYSTVGVTVAPPSFNWAGRKSLEWLAWRLDLTPEQTPRVGVYERGGLDAAQMGRDAVALGSRLGPEAIIAVGEKTAKGPEEELTAVMAHELGHLKHGDVVRAARARRLRAAALAATIAGGAGALLAGVWIPLAAGGALWLAAALLGRAHLRQMELRADRYGAWAAGEDGMRRFIERTRPVEASGWLGRVLSTHPSSERRLKNLD